MTTYDNARKKEIEKRKEFMKDFERRRFNREQHEKEAKRLQTAKEWLFNEHRKVLPNSKSITLEESTQKYYMKMDTVNISDEEFEILKNQFE